MDMAGKRRWTVAVAVVSTLVIALAAAPASGADVSACATTTGGGWAASTCLAIGSASTASGPVQVSTTVTMSGSGPRVAKVEYSMRGQHLITDYQVPYQFSLDTRDFVDGTATVVATAVFRDGTTADPVSVTVDLANGVTTQPGPTGSWTPPTAPAATAETPVVFAAVGDGAGGEQAATDVTDMMASWTPQLFTYLGDVYEDGTMTEYRNWYGDSTSWFGRFADITAPVVGNHEYNKDQGQFVADGYFRYWNDIPHYYSFDAGGWHFIGLDSTTQYGQTAVGSPQYQWLAEDLATRANPCTVVMYHHPLNTIGSEAPSQRMSAIWSLLRQHDVTLVLNGHDHQYQHWMPLGADQQPDPDGVTQVVAGAGGHSSQGLQSTDARVLESAQAYGALRLEVYPERIDYTYRTPNGGSGKVLDSGFLGCQALSPDTTVPSAPTSLTAQLGAPVGSTSTADLAWSAAADDRGVAQYRVHKDGAVVATLPAGTRTYQAKALQASTHYTFTVTALDAAGNESPASPPASVTTPAPHPVTLSVVASEDTYTSEQSPTRNYGRSTTLRHDSDPLMQSYVKFAVTGSYSTVTKATLRVWANQKATGLTARTVPPSWSELTMTATNAPPPDAVAGSVGSFPAGGWVDIDVTPAVAGNGTYAFQLRSTQTTAFTVDSREGGATAPTLVVDSVPPPDTTPPTTPTGLTATAPSQNRVELAWNPSTDADSVVSYTVYRDGEAVDSVPGTSFVDTDVNAQRTYTYTVDAVDPSDNHSATSAPASVRPPDETPPELPDPFDVVITGATSVGVRWGGSTDNVGVTGYRLLRNGATVAQLGPGAESWDDDGLTPGESYTYALTASDAAGNSSEPVTGSVTIPADTSDTTPPTVPGSVQAAATGETAVSVGWTLSTDDSGVSGYEIFRDGVSAGLVSASTDAWLDTGRTPDTTYTYRVRAVDLAANYSALSPPATATTWAVDTTPPTVPTGVAATGASLTSIAVSWTASTDERGVAGYRVYRDGATVANLTATQTSWTDTGLTTGASHDYAVDAIDGSGNRSAASDPVTARTQVPDPVTLSFPVAADTYVNAGSPTSRYGSATTLRLDGDPEIDTWLRFTTSGLQPTVTSAVLRIYANGKNVSPVDVHTSAGPWDEGLLSFATAPAFGGTVATAAPTTQAGWVEIPVTVAVAGNGTVTFVLAQSGKTAVSYASREGGGATAPTLVVTSSY